MHIKLIGEMLASDLINSILEMSIFIFFIALIKIIYKNKEVSESVYLIICTIALIYLSIIKNQYMGSVIAIMILQSVVSVITIFITDYLKLKLSDYIILFDTIFFIKIITQQVYISYYILFILLWGVFCILVKFRYKKLINMCISCFLSYISVLIGYSAFYLLYYKIFKKIYVNYMRMYNPNKWQKIITLVVIACIIIVLLVVILYILKLILKRFFYQLTDFSEKYDEIGFYILIIPFVLGIILLLIEILYFVSEIYKQHIILVLIIIFVLSIFGMQLLYIKMLLNTIRLKEHLSKQEENQSFTKEYNDNLQQNLIEVRAIKHDLKNVFLTMGEFVERSNDEEMKLYYKEKIVPFASQEFKINDLYVGLQEIKNEGLKAFFYYKFMQALDKKIDVKLQAEMDGTFFDYFPNLPDLIRVLGIFIDNAIEETIYVENKVIQINIREKENKFTITIKNYVRSNVKERGIVAGTTTKGLGRGMGLSVAQKIISKYDDLLWNSYFQDDMYVQMLKAEKYKK